MPPKKPSKRARAVPNRRNSERADAMLRSRAEKPKLLQADKKAMQSRTPQLGPAGLLSAPFSVGMNVGPSLLPRNAGKPQMRTDVTSPEDWTTQIGVRQVGSDLTNINLNTGTGTTNNYSIVTCPAITISTAVAGVYISPVVISPRLARAEQNYQYYAFREILFEVLPGQAPNAAGGTYNLALGIMQDPDNFTAYTPNLSTLAQNVLELVPSVGFSAWEGGKLLYTFHGSRVWETDQTGNSSELWQQCYLMGGITSAKTDNLFLGSLRVSYVIDFYCPTNVLGTPALSLRHSFEDSIRALETLARGSDSSERKLSKKQQVARMLKALTGFHSPKRVRTCPEAFALREEQILSFAKYILDTFVSDDGVYRCPVRYPVVCASE